MQAGETAKRQFILDAIKDHKASVNCSDAVTAARYYKGETDIKRHIKTLENRFGQKVPDVFAANSNISSNWYFYFVTQAVQYALANGVTFDKPDTKDKLGKDFDEKLQEVATYAKNGGAGYGFFNLDHIQPFSYEEFVPLYDEDTGALRAGIRFWQLEDDKPLRAKLFEVDGYTDYIKRKDDQTLQEMHKQTPYKRTIAVYKTGEEEYLDGANYAGLPVVPMYNVGNQSELKNNKNLLDSFELSLSNLSDAVNNDNFTYWVVKNTGGYESKKEIKEAIDLIRETHVVALDEDGDASPHNVTPPIDASMTALEKMKTQLFNNFMALKVEDISAGDVTATQIRAAYEPINQKTKLFYNCVRKFIQGVLDIAGIDDTPHFQPDVIANKKEDLEMVLQAGEYLDTETKVKKIAQLVDAQGDPEDILRKMAADEAARFGGDEE